MTSAIFSSKAPKKQPGPEEQRKRAKTEIAVIKRSHYKDHPVTALNCIVLLFL